MALANINRKRVYEDSTVDICTYMRYVIAGLFQLIIITVFLLVLLVIAGALVVFPVIWWYQMIVAGAVIPPGNDAAAIGTCIIAFAAVWYTIVALSEKIAKWMATKKSNRVVEAVEPKEPGFVELVREKIKSKTCFTVTFTKD